MTAGSAPHIAYLVQQFPPEVGAGPARVTEMARRWRASGARVTVITGIPGRALPGRAFGEGDPAYRRKLFVAEEWEGIRVLRSWLYATPSGALVPTLLNNGSFMLTSALHALARLGRVDVLIASEPPLLPHAAGALVALARRIPLVLEIRDLWPDYLVGMGRLSPDGAPTRALFALERALLARAASVVAVTDSFRRRIAAKGVPQGRIHVIPNGVDLERYRRAAGPPPLEEMQPADGRFVVGYLGTFGAGQDLTTVVDAAALVAEADAGVRIVLAGDGNDRPRVEAYARARSVPNLFIRPTLPKERTPAFYNACDACLVPLAPVGIFQETIPSKIFEVMACERPVLASLGGEGQRIVEQSGAGLVTPPGDARALAEAILRLRAAPADERDQMGARGRRFVAEHYNRHTLADRYLDLLREASAARRRI